jgi:glutamyl-tRNA synthetase
LAERFSPDKLNKAPAVFDYKKLEWYNGQYIRMKGDEELAALALPSAITEGLFGAAAAQPSPQDQALFIAAMPLIRERVSFVNEIPGKLGYLFKEPPAPAAAEVIPKKSDLPQTIRLLEIGRDLTGPLSSLNDAEAEALVKDRAEKEGLKLGDLLMPLRVAITGARISPPLFGSIRILGAERSLARVDKALRIVTN